MQRAVHKGGGPLIASCTRFVKKFSSQTQMAGAVDLGYDDEERHQSKTVIG